MKYFFGRALPFQYSLFLLYIVAALITWLRVFAESLLVLASLEQVQKLLLCFNGYLENGSLILKLLWQGLAGWVDGPHLRVEGLEEHSAQKGVKVEENAELVET